MRMKKATDSSSRSYVGTKQIHIEIRGKNVDLFIFKRTPNEPTLRNFK